MKVVYTYSKLHCVDVKKSKLYKQQDAVISKKSYHDVIVHVQNFKYPLYESPKLALKVVMVKG